MRQIPLPSQFDFFRQSDPRWSTVKLGITNLTLGRVGCKTVAMTIGHNKIAPQNRLTPDKLARTLKYTRDGLMIHDQEYPDMKFVKRVWRGVITEELRGYTQLKDRFALIAVNQNTHWVFCKGIYGKDFFIIDPFDGKGKWLLKSYKPCGYELMIRA